jgi:hypothetical protein
VIALLAVLASGSVAAASVAPVRVQESPDKAERLRRLRELHALPDGFVQFARVPDEGIGPRAGFGAGEVALLYFRPGSEGGDLMIARTADEGRTFTAGKRVNPISGSVATEGDCHTGSVDVGPDGAANVVWTTPGPTRRLCFARMERDSEAPTLVDLGSPAGLGAWASVALDKQGRVYVFYVANDPARAEDPLGRCVWLRKSLDGVEFDAPVSIDEKQRGVSDQSALASHVDRVMGTVFVLYRTAYVLKPGSPSLARGMRLIHSSDGVQFDSVWVDNWKGIRDPRSVVGLSQEENSTLATWESGGDVFWSIIRRQLKKVEVPMTPQSEGPPVVRSRPAGASGGGEVLLTWLERPKGEPTSPLRLGWRIWLRELRAPIAEGFAPEAPRSGGAVVLPRAGGGFTILY